MHRHVYLLSWMWLLLIISSMPAHAGIIAIIIDDIGYNYSAGQKSAALHPSITLSVLPATPFARKLTNDLSLRGHELMLHIPMQAQLTKAPKEPVVLTENMHELEYKAQIEAYLHEFPEVSGVNNHMGSLLTQKPKQMEWLMEVLSAQGFLYFVDSRTHKKTVAERIASKFTINNARRDVFLDHGKNRIKSDWVWSQVRKLEHKAERNGFALAIGHPHPKTLAVLQKALPWLEAQGHTIVPISRYIQLKGSLQCPECSSPSLKVVKN
ncbi:MAG: divergent polysaccharide deacetylase family protein [Thiothrix sp.]|nr:MAG: divergent polysaccharide deacetylase family protein [Thiothrix sp.]